MELQWVGPEAAEEIARIARELFFEVYKYVSDEGLEMFIESCQTPEKIRDANMEESWRGEGDSNPRVA